MDVLRRLFGSEDEREMPRDARASTDQQAVARYRYLIRTAPPEAIEQAHEQAFAQLTPEQRRMALHELSSAVPLYERLNRDDPQSLARMATRAELQQPGAVERIFAGPRAVGGGYGSGGGLLGGTFMSSLAGAFVGSIIAQGLYDSFADIPTSSEDAEDATADGEYSAQESSVYEQGVDGDVGGDFGGDLGGTDF